MLKVSDVIFCNRVGVKLENNKVELIILTGGGHIASFTLKADPLNPLWVPPWKSTEPGLRKICDKDEMGESEESQILASIMGHNLCLDVFGDHSKGEMKHGLLFHGEAGLVNWDVNEFSNKKKI